MAVDMKNLIAEKLHFLIKKKPLEKITVKDIVEECNISRQAFYYHFQDIMDVMEWTMQQGLQGLLDRTLDVEDPEEALRIFISYAAESQELVQKLLHSQRREQIEIVLTRSIRNYLEAVFQHKASNVQISYADKEVALDFYSYGIGALLFTHVGKKDFDVNTLSHQLYLLLKGELISLGN